VSCFVKLDTASPGRGSSRREATDRTRRETHHAPRTAATRALVRAQPRPSHERDRSGHDDERCAAERPQVSSSWARSEADRPSTFPLAPPESENGSRCARLRRTATRRTDHLGGAASWHGGHGSCSWPRRRAMPKLLVEARPGGALRRCEVRPASDASAGDGSYRSSCATARAASCRAFGLAAGLRRPDARSPTRQLSGPGPHVASRRWQTLLMIRRRPDRRQRATSTSQ